MTNRAVLRCIVASGCRVRGLRSTSRFVANNRHGPSGTRICRRLDVAADRPDTNTRWLDTGLNIASFAQDLDGELYLLDYAGAIYRFEPVAD